MKGSILKERLRRGELALGAWICYSDPAVGEVMSDLGFDWICIDAEHVAFPLDKLQNLLIGLKGTESLVIVRIAGNDPVLIKQVLDLGFDGVMVPWVNTAEEARRAVAACKYPPEGIRGFGPRRASDYGRNIAEYVEHANENTFVVLQAENIKAVENINEIMSVPGVDVVLIGPADLTMSMGLFLQFDHPEVQSAFDKILEAGKKTGVPVGLASDAETTQKMITRGVQFFSVCWDEECLVVTGSNALSTMRTWLDQNK
jgi:2-keto-3-deoxy-L-rhamnonate aldolase RhmA